MLRQSARGLLRMACMLLLWHDVCGALISSSRLEQCFNDGNPETLLDCAQRITVALAVPAGQVGTEELHMVSDPSKGERELEHPIRLTISKTHAVVRYQATCKQHELHLLHRHGA